MTPDDAQEPALALWLRRLPRALLVYRPRHLFYRRLSEWVSPGAAAPEGLEFHRVTHNNVRQIEEWKGEAHARRLRGLLDRGYVGVCGLIHGRVVSQLWGMPRRQAWSPVCWHEPIEVGEIMLVVIALSPFRGHIGIADAYR